MKMRILSKKTLALLMTLAMLMSCMVWSGVSAATNWNVFTCNFDTQPVKSNGTTAAGYTANSTVGSGDNTVAANGSALYVLDDTNGYMKVTKTAANTLTNYGFRLYGDAGSWQTSINGTTVISNSDKSRALSGIRYYATVKYKVVSCAAPATITMSVLGGSVQSGYSNTGEVASKDVTSADVSDEWITWSAVYTAPSSNAWLMGVRSSGACEIHFDDIVVEYVPDSRLATYTLDDNNGGTTTYQAVDGKALAIPDGVRSGYNFAGWYTDADCTTPYEAPATAVAGSYTLYAKWEELATNSTITFDCGDLTTVDEIKGEAGSAATLPTPEVDGYRFDGWYDSEGNPVTAINFPETVGDTITLTGKFSKQVTHTFYYNNGNSFTTLSTYEGDVMSYPSIIVANDYTVASWNTELAGTGTTYTTKSVSPAEALTLYAQLGYVNVETHDTEGFQSYWASYADNNGTGYAKAPIAYRTGVMAGNGSGVILSHLHSYDVATGTDLPATDPAVGGYSAAIHLSGNNFVTCPKHVLTGSEAKVMLNRGRAYTVKFMAYVDEAMDVPFFLGTVPTGNYDFNNMGQEAYGIETDTSAKVSLPAAQWTEVTLTIDSLQGYNQTSSLAMFLGINNWTAGKYVYIDYVRIVEAEPYLDVAMDFENYKDGTIMALAGTNKVTTKQNATVGGEKSLYIKGNWGGASRPQWMVTNEYGELVKIEEGASYRISFRLMRPADGYGANIWFTATNSSGSFGNNGNPSKDNARLIAGSGSTAIGTQTTGSVTEYSKISVPKSFVWYTYTLTLNNVLLSDESKATDCYLRMGVGPDVSGELEFYVDDIVVQKLDSGYDYGVQSFEDGYAVGDDLELRGQKTSTDDNFDAVISNAHSRTGTNSLKITSKKIQSGNIRAQIALKDGNGDTIRLTNGNAYNITFWVKFTDANWTPGLFFWLAGSDDGTAFTSSGDKDTNLVCEPNYYSDSNRYVRPAYNTWTKVSITFTVNNANITDTDTILLGIAHLPRMGEEATAAGCNSGSYEKAVDFYLDDLTVTPVAGLDSMDKVDKGYQYVVGGTQDNGAIEGEAGSAIYVQNDVEKTAFRVGATYIADSDGVTMDKVRLSGHHYEIVERGILLGYADKLNGRELKLETTAAEGLAGKTAITEGLDNHWKYDGETNQVTYTMLVKGVTKALKDTKFVARSYLKVTMEGRTHIIYSDASNVFTPQGIYTAANDLWIADTENNPDGISYGWFTEDQVTE